MNFPGSTDAFDRRFIAKAFYIFLRKVRIHFGVDHSGSDAVHSDAGWGKLFGKRLCKTDNCCL